MEGRVFGSRYHFILYILLLNSAPVSYTGHELKPPKYMMSGTSLPPDHNRGPLVLGWIWSTTALAIIAVGMRMFSRSVTRAFGWDDFLIVAALLLTVLGSAVNQVQVDYGFGRHIVYVLANAEEIAMWTIVAQLQNVFAVTFLKLSVSLFILRMIRGTHQNIQRILWGLMAVLILVNTTQMFVQTFQCFPLKKAWNADVPGRCISSIVLVRLTEASGIVGCIVDLSCVIIPLFILRTLNLNRRTKIALMVILSLGIIPGACAIGKSITTNYGSKDLTYAYVPVLIFAALEVNVGIVVACLPTLRPIFHGLLGTKSMRAEPARSSTWHMMSSSKIKQNISAMRSRSARTYGTYGTVDESDERNPVPRIQVSHTLDVAIELADTPNQVDVKKYPDGQWEHHIAE